MSYKNKSIIFNQNNLLNKIEESNIKLLVPGQGVFIFKNNNNNSLSLLPPSLNFFFYNQSQNDGLYVEFNEKNLFVQKIFDHSVLVDKNNHVGLSNLKGAYYWFSIDAQNQKLYGGIGEARLETVIYQYTFPHKSKQFLESIDSIKIGSASSKFIKPIQLFRDPITEKVPLLVKNTNSLTMNDIAKGTYMPKANLSLVSQKLYDCISGEKFVLDDADFPDFSKAIEYSIITPGKWCYEKIKDKSTEFNKDKPNILETYLRITLGKNNGESPGIPYVMEIWPIGHYSPIHCHAGANAVIRILHGNINVKLFPFLCNQKKDGVKEFGIANFVKDDITWISPNLNQIHQLENDASNTETCITIQCYMYDNENTTHYDYFDYLDEKGNIMQYEPDSDMDFIAFKSKMFKEWNERG
jgi:hypothetical protein